MKLEKCTPWDARFLLMCDMIASWSEDTSRKVGCVIVGPMNEIRATGYNGLPRGVDSEPQDRHEHLNGEKYLWFEHAERNAIYNAASTGTPIYGCSLYVNSFPCADCARGLIQSGITELRTFGFDATDSKYGRHFDVSSQMLQEAGVALKLFDRGDLAIREQAIAFENARAPENNLLR